MKPKANFQKENSDKKSTNPKVIYNLNQAKKYIEAVGSFKRNIF